MPTKFAAFVLAVSLAACASARAKKPASLLARCNEEPQWITQNVEGQRVGIFICFGEENKLLYTTQVLPPLPPEPPKKTMKDLILAVDTSKPKIKKPSAPADTKLPTLGGTAAEKK